MDEALCKERPWAPCNAPAAWHPLAGTERLLDTHFRLLRYDSLAEPFENARLLMQQLQQPDSAGACPCSLAAVRALQHFSSRVCGMTAALEESWQLQQGSI